MLYQNQHFGISEYFCKESGENLEFPPHMHHSFEFITILEGQISVTVEDKEFLLVEGDSALIFPEQVHAMRSEKSKHSLVIFSPDIVSAYSKRHSGEIPTDIKLKASEYVISEFLALDENSSVFKIKSILYGVCAAFDENAEFKKKKSDENGLLKRVFEFVENNYDKQCDLKTLGNALGYNGTYLSRFFHDVTNISYTSYVNRYKIGKACYLLKNTDKTVLECAYECGYLSIRNFNRNFKSVVGNSPKEYRNGKGS